MTDEAKLTFYRGYYSGDKPRDLHNKALIHVYLALASSRLIPDLQWKNAELTVQRFVLTKTEFNEQFQPFKVEAGRYYFDDNTADILREWKKYCENNSSTWIDTSKIFRNYTYGEKYSTSIGYVKKTVNAVSEAWREHLISAATIEWEKNENLNPAIRELKGKIEQKEDELSALRHDLYTLRYPAAVAVQPTSANCDKTDLSLRYLGLSTRTYNSLYRSGISSVEKLVEEISRNPRRLLELRNFGRTSLDEVLSKLKEKGIVANVH